jgi:hypothetical protein
MNQEKMKNEGSSTSLDSSRSSLADPYAVVKTHQKSSSADSTRRNRSSSGGKSRTGTRMSSQAFPASELSRSRDSSLSGARPKKTVRFDPATTLLHLCQYGDGSESCLGQVKRCLEGITEMNDPDVDINNVYSPQQWLTPLHVACSHGKAEIARILLDAGAAVNITDKEGWTPLHCAAAEGHLEVLKLLGKCQGNSSDLGQRNPALIYVLDGPIDLQPLNDDNELPQDVALEAKEEEIQKLLAGSFFIDIELRIQFPSPLRDKEEVSADETYSDSEEEENEEVEIPTPVNDFSKNLRRAVSVMKHSRPDHHRRESDDIHPQDMPLVNPVKAAPVEDFVVRPSSPTLESAYSPLVVSPINFSTHNEVDQPRPEHTVVVSRSDKVKVSAEANPESSVNNPPVDTTPKKTIEDDTQAKLKIDCTVRNPLVASQSLETFREQSQSVENLKNTYTSVGNLQLPTEITEPFSPTTSDSRKARRTNSITRNKKPTEFETERASHAGEQMRPKELQRRTSKSQKDAPTAPKSVDVNTESIPSVASLKRSLTSLSKTEVKRSEETLATSIQDKIKMFSGGQEPKIMKSHKKGQLAQ